MQRVMDTGGLTDQYEVKNPHFNPKTREVFTGVNYGRRPHGSTTTYGWSHMVLNDRFKTNAIYFAGDTFEKNTADTQASYDLLGTLFLHASNLLRQELIKACIQGMSLSDQGGDNPKLLVEAHLFETLSFRGGVEKMHVYLGDVASGNEYAAVYANANKFATRHGIAITFDYFKAS
jgi:hypothetical protein